MIIKRAPWELLNLNLNSGGPINLIDKFGKYYLSHKIMKPENIKRGRLGRCPLPFKQLVLGLIQEESTFFYT